MAIRRFKQIGVAGDGSSTARARFRRPSKPIKPGDTVVLQYTDGKIDTVIARIMHSVFCEGCKYAGVGTSCPCYVDQAGFMYCIFGGKSYAVDIDTVMEDI